MLLAAGATDHAIARDDVALVAVLACIGARHGAVVDQTTANAEAVTLPPAHDGVVALKDATDRIASASMARKSMFLY